MHARDDTDNSIWIFKPFIGERGGDTRVRLSKNSQDAGLKDEEDRKSETRHGLKDRFVHY